MPYNIHRYVPIGQMLNSVIFKVYSKYYDKKKID